MLKFTNIESQIEGLSSQSNEQENMKDNIDILIVGDSYAEGDGVNSKDNIAASFGCAIGLPLNCNAAAMVSMLYFFKN